MRTDLCFSRPTNSGGAGLGDGHQNGAVLWQFTNVSTIGLTAPVSATTTHVGPGGGVVGKVFVMSGGMQSKLYALDAQTGAMLWASDHVVGPLQRPAHGYRGGGPGCVHVRGRDGECPRPGFAAPQPERPQRPLPQRRGRVVGRRDHVHHTARDRANLDAVAKL